jgi:hypothetical protein
MTPARLRLADTITPAESARARSIFAIPIDVFSRLMSVATSLASGTLRMSKRAALARAIGTIDNTDERVRVWRYAEASLVDNSWVCLLEDDSRLHVVEVNSQTGVATHVISTPMTGSGHRR